MKKFFNAKKSTKHKIKNIFICSAFAIVVAAALFLCVTMLNSINLRMNESATSNLLNTTQIIVNTLEGLIEKDQDSLKVVGADYFYNGIPDIRQLQVFRETMGLDWIGVIDIDGNGTDCLGNRFYVYDYLGENDWNLREEGYSDSYIGRQSGRPQITLWVPIYDGDEYIGTVLGNVILTQYYSASIFTFYKGEGRTYIFDGADGSWILKSLGTDGTSFYQEDIYSLLSSSQNTENDISLFRETVEAGLRGTAVLNFNGELSYLCFMSLPSSPDWYVATVIAKKTLLRESSEVQKMIQVMLIVFILTCCVAAIVFAAWVVRKTKRHESKYREALFANISSNLDSAFLIYEKETRKTVFVSENTKRLFGIDRGWLAEDVRRLFDWCKIPEDDEIRKIFLNGDLEKADVREVCIENELGETSRMIRLELIPADLGQELAVLTDITGDKHIQRSLIEAMNNAEAANNAKNDFLSAMSHDLRTPINGIVGMTTIAATHLDDKNRVRDCLDKISESTAHLLSLINEVLDMSQLESGRIELSSEPFNIAELLQNVLNVNYPGIQQKNQTVKVHIKLMEHERVIGDPVRLTRITANLISNAIKYTKSGGEITLLLREKEAMIHGYGCYELVVQDNGIGMSPEFMERLFMPFEREEDVRLSRIQGTGLGLSIVKNMVERMMGSIHCESEKGVGTTFTVTVNLRLDENSDEAKQLKGLPVLVVDDDVTACQNVSEILKSIGMHAEWTDDSLQAIELVKQRHDRSDDYLAVILDWKMPGMDGIETVRRIRNDIAKDVPIIILTAYEWGRIEAEAKEAGVDGFLSKPVYKTKLMQKMTEILDGKIDVIDSPLNFSLKDRNIDGKVLLVEDNDLNMEIAVELLRIIGIEADCAENGAVAVKRFADSKVGTYKLIFMDIQMPRMNGYDATRAIRNMEREDSKTVAIVAMTADAFKKDEQLAFEAGMNEHLSKPISCERLSQVLYHYLCELPETRKENENE